MKSINVKPAFAIGGAGTGLLLAITTLVGATRESAAADPAPADPADSPIVRFAKLMPALSHARCLNCHGGTDPFSGSNHPSSTMTPRDAREMLDASGDQIAGRNGACVECHDASNVESEDANGVITRHANGPWRLAPKAVEFVGKDALALCKQFQGMDLASVLRRHLKEDDLIRMSFEGYLGGAVDVADPPPLSRQGFLDAVDVWLSDGEAILCSGWIGTITQEETFSSNYGYPIQAGTGPSTVTVHESAKRVMTISLTRNGDTTAHVQASGHQTMQTVIHDVGPNGPCTSTGTTNHDWGGTNDGGALARIKVAPDGSYTIRFLGPQETTSGDGSSELTSDCGPLSVPRSQDSPIELVWPAWSFTIEDRLASPRDRRQLAGSMTKTVKPDGSDAANPQSWLEVSPAGVSRGDSGAPLPISVKTAWDLKLEE